MGNQGRQPRTTILGNNHDPHVRVVGRWRWNWWVGTRQCGQGSVRRKVKVTNMSTMGGEGGLGEGGRASTEGNGL